MIKINKNNDIFLINIRDVFTSFYSFIKSDNFFVKRSNNRQIDS